MRRFPLGFKYLHTSRGPRDAGSGVGSLWVQILVPLGTCKLCDLASDFLFLSLLAELKRTAPFDRVAVRAEQSPGDTRTVPAACRGAQCFPALGNLMWWDSHLAPGQYARIPPTPSLS